MLKLEKLAPILFLIMWSSGAIFVKMGLEDASVWSFLTLRATGAFVLMTLIVFIWREQQMRLFANMSKSAVGKMMLAGLLLQVCYQGCYFLAIHFQLSPGLIAMVLGLQPLVTPFVAKEYVSPKGYVALLLGFVGLLLAVYGAKDVSHITVIGVAFGVAALLAITVGSVYQKNYIQNLLHPLLFKTVWPQSFSWRSHCLLAGKWTGVHNSSYLQHG